jgi:hypothetical protein
VSALDLRLQPGPAAGREHGRAVRAQQRLGQPALAAARQLLASSWPTWSPRAPHRPHLRARGGQPAAARAHQQVDPRRGPARHGRPPFELGWDHVKLYFMIGLPTERDDDIEAIADLALRTLARPLAHQPQGAQVNLGVSTFVPKPFTPFQWAARSTLEETERRSAILSARRSPGAVKFGRHDPEETFLEGLVSAPTAGRRTSSRRRSGSAPLRRLGEHLGSASGSRRSPRPATTSKDALRARTSTSACRGTTSTC